MASSLVPLVGSESPERERENGTKVVIKLTQVEHALTQYSEHNVTHNIYILNTNRPGIHTATHAHTDPSTRAWLSMVINLLTTFWEWCRIVVWLWNILSTFNYLIIIVLLLYPSCLALSGGVLGWGHSVS